MPFPIIFPSARFTQMSNTDMSFLGVQKEVLNPFLKVYVFPFYTRGRIRISLFFLS